MPGTTSPRRSVSTPPTVTLHFTSSPFLPRTLSCMAPSSSRMVSPVFTSCGRLGRLTGTTAASPSMSLVVNITVAPFFKVAWPSLSLPVRYFGPGRSMRIATFIPSRWLILLTARMYLAWTSCVPCDRLSRATFIPLLTRRSMTEAVPVAGPMVHTILVLLLKYPVCFTPGLRLAD